MAIQLLAGRRATATGTGGPCLRTLVAQAELDAARHGGELRLARAGTALAVAGHRERYEGGPDESWAQLHASRRAWVEPRLELGGAAGIGWFDGQGVGPSLRAEVRWKSLGEGLQLQLASGAEGPRAQWAWAEGGLQHQWLGHAGGPWVALRAGGRAVDARAPRLLQPGADSSDRRSFLLRAHPLASTGRLDPGQLAPQVAGAGLELGWFARWRGLVEWGPLLFVDHARADRGELAGGRSDAGAGLRAGALGQQVELFLARSLDGEGEHFGLRLVTSR